MSFAPAEGFCNKIVVDNTENGVLSTTLEVSMYRGAFLIFWLFLLFAFSAESSLACTYSQFPVDFYYATSDVIVVGKVESVKPAKRDYQTVVVNIEKRFKGHELKQIVLNQPQSGGCGVWDFTDYLGETVLLYVVLNRKTKQYSAWSTRGGRVEKMSEELYWLNALPMSLKRTRIAGTIELWTESVANYWEHPFKFIRNVAGTKVRVFSDKNSYELVTDKNGVYEIWDIPPGKYKVEAVLPPDLIPHLEMEKGPIDKAHYRSLYDSDGSLKENTKYSVLFDIQPNSCAGIDFVVNQKPTK